MTSAAPLPVVICAECGDLADCVTGARIYPHRADLHAKFFWLCACGAYCGCHGKSKDTLGTPAHSELRKARGAAHAAFDRLWQLKMVREGISKHGARGAAYAWLSDQMDLLPEQCHIAMMTAAQCQRVIDVCTKPETRRADKPAPMMSVKEVFDATAQDALDASRARIRRPGQRG